MRPRILRPVVSILPLLFGACSASIDTPRPAVTGVAPNVVCDTQFPSTVTLTGINFTPMPTRTLRKLEQLQLPAISLSEATTLDGMPAPMMPPVTIFDSAAQPDLSHVHWESEAGMRFDVTPDLLMPGVYDVTVTNPDKHSATLARSLAVVPPPSVTSVVPANVCVAQGDHSVVINGANFLQVGTAVPLVTLIAPDGTTVTAESPMMAGCFQIAGSNFDMISECTTMMVVIPMGSPVGTYSLVVSNPAPAACSSTEPIQFVIEPPPTVTGVTPARICSTGGTLTLTGTGFLPGATASISDPTTMMSFDASMTTVNGPTSATAKFVFPGSAPLNAGDMVDVSLRNSDGCSGTLKNAATVVQGPIIFYVDPPFVYGGITTPVTVYTTGLTDPLMMPGGVVLTSSTNPSAAPIDLTSVSHIDPNHPKHIIIAVPPSLPTDSYNLTVTTTLGCSYTYMNAITVKTTTTALKDIVPPFGYDKDSTPVTIDATASFFKPGARAYLAPTGMGSVLATPLTAVVFQSDTQLTAIVPASTTAPLPDGSYDVVVVNPDGTIGLLASGFTVVPNRPPVVTGSPPGSLPTNCGTACAATINGLNFVPAAPPVVTTTCTPTPATAVTVTLGTPTTTTLPITLANINSTNTPGGTVCTFRVTQQGVYADGGTIVVTNPAANLTATTQGPDMHTARRAPAMVYNGPTAAARYTYVVGGDSGMQTAPLGTFEFSKADGVNGGFGAWTQLPDATRAYQSGQGALTTARTFAGGVSVGRFIYVVGGFDGTNALKTVERAEVLDPAESPQITDADLNPDPTNGLQPGLYFYRIAALMDAGDGNNPAGETLAGDEFAINVPAFGNKKIQVTLVFAAGPSLAGRTVAKWHIYRTTNPGQAPGTEDALFETADATSTTFVDKGATPVVGRPMPFGALGKWRTITPQLTTARAGAGVAVAPDPSVAGRFFVYAGFGWDGTNFPTSYEVLRVDVAGTTVTEQTWSQQAITGSTGRWQLGAWAATPDVNPILGANIIYFGTGLAAATGSTPVTEIDGGSVTTGTGVLGNLGTLNISSAKYFGYGAVTAVNSLFELGGHDNAAFLSKMDNISIINSTGGLGPSFGPSGNGTLGAATYLPGATLGGAYFWIAGGSQAAGTATASTYFVLY
jgi:hypothetical protein